MAFLAKDKKVYAVFVRSRRDGRDVLIREPYNVVEWGDGSTYIEGVENPDFRMMAGSDPTIAGVPYGEIYTGVRVYDTPPFLTRFGAAM